MTETTTPREELALGLAISFIQISETEFHACIGNENITKEDLAQILGRLKEKICRTKQ